MDLSAGGPRAIVIGGSMAGLLTALLLRREGWQADVYERAGGELAGRGAGIVTHALLYEVLRRAGIDIDPAQLGVGVPGRRFLTNEGSIAIERPLEQVLTSWGRLFKTMRNFLPDDHYHHGKNFDRVEDGAEGVRVYFDDGTHTEADLLIGADGLFSTVRRQFLPAIQPNYVGYVAWRGLVEESDLSAATHAALFEWFAFGLPEGEQILGYPVAGAEEALARGHRRYNFVWYRPAATGEPLRQLLTDTDGVEHALSIPPNRIRPAIVAQMRADADRLLPPPFAEVVQRTVQPFLQAIMDLETPAMVLGATRRVALVGDAAFVARPHVGMGVTKAAADADGLASALAAHPRDVAIALHRYERERLPHGAAIVRRARHLGAYMQAQHRTNEERLMAERHRSPEAVITETAMPSELAA